MTFKYGGGGRPIFILPFSYFFYSDKGCPTVSLWCLAKSQIVWPVDPFTCIPYLIQISFNMWTHQFVLSIFFIHTFVIGLKAYLIVPPGDNFWTNCCFLINKIDILQDWFSDTPEKLLKRSECPNYLFLNIWSSWGIYDSAQTCVPAQELAPAQKMGLQFFFFFNFKKFKKRKNVSPFSELEQDFLWFQDYILGHSWKLLAANLKVPFWIGVFLRFTDPVLQPREVNHGPRNIKTLDMPKSVSVEVLSSKSKVSVTVDGTTVSNWVLVSILNLRMEISFCTLSSTVNCLDSQLLYGT